MEQVDSNEKFLKNAVRVMLYAIIVCIVILMVILLQTPLGDIWRRLFDNLFGVGTGQETWFITRSSGLIAYLLLWLSTVWGLGVSSKFFDRVVPRAFTYDAHEYISLLAIGMTFIHVVILLWDTFTPFNLAQLVVPFVSSYRPFWTGVGIIGTYLTLLVTVTFYLRKQIGIAAFRAIHWFSFIAFFGVLFHSWFGGTDTNFALTRAMYIGTAFVVVLMTFLWLFTRRSNLAMQDRPIKATAPVMAAAQTLPTQPTATYEPLVLPPLSPKTEGTRWQSSQSVSTLPRDDARENSY